MATSSDFSSKFPPFDTSTFLSQFFWLVVIFGIFYWIMHCFVLPRLAFGMILRHNQISSDQSKMEAAVMELNSMTASYEEALAIARTNAKEIVQKAIIDAEKNLDCKRKMFEKDLLHKISGAQRKIESTQEKSLKELHSASEGITKDLIHKLMGISISDADIDVAMKKIKIREGKA